MNPQPDEPPRERALSGLLVLALGALLVEAVHFGSNLVVEVQERPSIEKGRCVYHVVKDNIPLGTVALNEPQSITEILASLSRTETFGRFDPSQVLPCKSIIRLSGEPPSATVEKMSGRHLLCAQGRININRADEAELSSAPGIGVTLARHILNARESAGPFSCTEDLLSVGGIGVERLQKLKLYVQVESSPEGDRSQYVQPCRSLLHPRGGVAR